MTELPKDRGKVVDLLIANPRRLFIAHACFGIASAIVLWVRPGTFTPYLPGRVGMGGSPSAFILVEYSPRVAALHRRHARRPQTALRPRRQGRLCVHRPRRRCCDYQPTAVAAPLSPGRNPLQTRKLIAACLKIAPFHGWVTPWLVYSALSFFIASVSD